MIRVIEPIWEMKNHLHKDNKQQNKITHKKEQMNFKTILEREREKLC